MGSVLDSVEASFKSLVSEKPYRSITVKEICERAFISRHTFYMNFVDKRAIVTYIFKRDAVDPVRRAIELLSRDEASQMAAILLGRFYTGVFEHAEYYENLVRPMAGVDPTFELVVARCVNKEIINLVKRFVQDADEQALRVVAYYHASAQALVLEKWICSGFEPPAEQLGEMQAHIMVPSFAWVIDRKPASDE